MKKMFAFLTAVSCAGTMISAIPASAKYDSYDVYSIESENLTFRANKTEVALEPAPESGIECNANFLIIGAFHSNKPSQDFGEKYSHNSYAVACLDAVQRDETGKIISYLGGAYGTISADELALYTENADAFDVGDLLYINNWSAREIYPPVFFPEKVDIADNPDMEATKVEYVGNALDIFGNDFMKVLRHEAVFDPSAYGMMSSKYLSDISKLDIIRGDATEDEEVNIVDVIAVNKNVLGKEKMSAYAQYVSDINGNGTVDSSDSLEILKYIVGLESAF